MFADAGRFSCQNFVIFAIDAKDFRWYSVGINKFIVVAVADGLVESTTCAAAFSADRLGRDFVRTVFVLGRIS